MADALARPTHDGGLAGDDYGWRLRCPLLAQTMLEFADMLQICTSAPRGRFSLERIL